MGFPKGVTYDFKSFSNSEIPLAFTVLQDFAAQNVSVVPPERFGPQS
jgi:hypothetical protein